MPAFPIKKPSHLPSTISEGDEEVTADLSNSRKGISGADSANGSEGSRTGIRQEDRAVSRTRILVGITILLCAVGIILAVNFLSKQSDTRSFELEYDGFVQDIQKLVRWEMRYNFALMEQFSSQISIAAGLINSTFPFHTEPQFQITAGYVDGMGGIMGTAFAPIVTVEQREEWENYTVNNQGWIQQSHHLAASFPKHTDALHGTMQDHEHDRRRSLRQHQHQLRQLDQDVHRESDTISPVIFKYSENGDKLPETNEAGKIFAPLWQVSPADSSVVNFNLLSDPRIEKLYKTMLEVNETVMSASTEIGYVFDFLFGPEEKHLKTHPHGIILVPVYRRIEDDPTIAGFAVALAPFGNLLDRLLPKGKDGIIGVFRDNCGAVSSFELTSGKARFLGYGDMHDPAFDEYETVEENLELYQTMTEDLCSQDLYLYPTEDLRSEYTTSIIGTYAAICGVALALGVIFLIYDMRVTRRQNKTLQSAMRSRAIVNSLFPEKIAREMVDFPMDASQRQRHHNNKYETFMSESTNSYRRKELSGKTSKPLADLFPEATVMFGDLVGFTAWSSLREPHQVFVLLETIYSAFDEVAQRRRVFKVETIGDCYVAVCGLPTPRRDHAATMARFASECCRVLPSILRELEVELGPDTTTLGIRIGLHSGPVTAGVLRGERARFQLFGDTVNTTARIESTGEKNRVHVSEETANQLIASGKEHWVVLREDKVSAKGKGELQTYWLKMRAEVTQSTASTTEGSENGDDSVISASVVSLSHRKASKANGLRADQERFVAWCVDILKRPLKSIIERRIATGIRADSPHRLKQAELNLKKDGGMTIDEVQEVITLPKYNAKGNAAHDGEISIELSTEVLSQLSDYVKTIACLYRDNPFHNYEHACHVLMSCSKLLSRIVSPDIEETGGSEAKVLHDHTYGITSDPLTQFSVLLSALIHDLDHPGVPNMQLTKENHELAVTYSNKSAAEQHSIDAAWELLMEDSYLDLRRAIYSNKEELVRFRRLTVNAVMATDIMDKELAMQRKARWSKAFSYDIETYRPSEEEDRNRKATIVIEHLIQASDVAHTMQHWHIYKKWNSRLFRENYLAYKAGRAAKNPLDGWYEGEIGFFDFYIIPLTKKLKDCGVFGVSSDEYLSYAEQNRKEWVKKGKEVVEELRELVRQEYSDESD